MDNWVVLFTGSLATIERAGRVVCHTKANFHPKAWDSAIVFGSFG